MCTSAFISSEKKSHLLSCEGIFGFVTVAIICMIFFLQTSCSGSDITVWKYDHGKDEWDRLKAVPESVDRRMSLRRHSLQLLSKDSASKILFVTKRLSDPKSYRIWTSNRDSIELLNQFCEPVDRVNCILSDSRGRFILGTSHGILMKEEGEWVAFRQAAVHSGVVSIVSRVTIRLHDMGNVLAIAERKDNSLWVSAELPGWCHVLSQASFVYNGQDTDGLHLWHGIKLASMVVVTQDKYNGKPVIHEGGVRKLLFRDAAGNLWAIGSNFVLLKYSASNTYPKWSYVKGSSLPGLQSLEREITGLLVSRDGTVWVTASTRHGGDILSFDGEKWTIHSDAKELLGQFNPTGITADSEDNLYVATDGVGIMKFDGTSWKFMEINHQLPKTKAITIEEFRKRKSPYLVPIKYICCDGKDRLWFGWYDMLFRHDLIKGISSSKVSAEEELKVNPTEVRKLVDRLRDKDETVRENAAKEIVRFANPSIVPALANASKDESRVVRCYVAKALGKIGNNDARDVLIAMLEEERTEGGKGAIAEALGHTQGKEAADAIAKLLKDDEGDVRKAAVRTLAGLGEEAVPPLIETLDHRSSRMRAEAAKSLGIIGAKASAPKLIELLRDQVVIVRSEAVEALGQIGDSSAVEPLIKSLGDKKEWIRLKAVIALGKIKDKGAVKPLIELLDDGEQIRTNVCKALGMIGDKSAIPVLMETLEKYNEGYLELRNLSGHHFEYYPYWPEDKRRQAIADLKAWWEENQNKILGEQ